MRFGRPRGCCCGISKKSTAASSTPKSTRSFTSHLAAAGSSSRSTSGASTRRRLYRPAELLRHGLDGPKAAPSVLEQPVLAHGDARCPSLVADHVGERHAVGMDS